MKLKVEVKKIASNPTDWAKESMKLVLNKSAESMAKQLSEKLKDVKCGVHGNNSRGTVTIKPNLNTNKFEFNKSNFCCKEFEDRIALT